jgi:lysozyme family protein
MRDYTSLIALNQKRWKTSVFKPELESTVAAVAGRLVKFKLVYQQVEVDTKVPWWAIAVIHEREASQRWDRSIAQGDPWNMVSVHEPRKRGPFKSWHDAAIDALVNCAPFAAKWTDWSAGGALTLLELYNGTGYESHGIASPYLWSGSQHYVSGKFVEDGPHGFRANVVDKQLGCAYILFEMSKLEGGELWLPSRLPEPSPSPQPSPSPSLLSRLASFVRSR